MAKLLPDSPEVLDIWGFLQTDGTVLLTLNDQAAGTFDFAEMVEGAIESVEHVETADAAIEGLRALKAHLSVALDRTNTRIDEINAIRAGWVDVGKEAGDGEA